MDAGYRVHLANTTAIKKYEGLKYREDFADAAYLAQLLRLGLLPEGYIYPREERAGRDLGRKRMQLVRCHYWITSSARSKIDCGIVMPSALAVLRLITSSTFVGCRTGSSAGLAPVSTLPV